MLLRPCTEANEKDRVTLDRFAQSYRFHAQACRLDIKPEAGAVMPVPAGSARVGPVSAIPKVLASFGLETRTLLAAAGLDANLFENPQNFVALSALGALFEYCASATKCPHFGLLVGANCDPHSLGLVDLLASNEPDVGAAVRDFVSYMYVFDRATFVWLSVEHDMASVAYAVVEPGIPGIDQISDVGAAIICNVLRQWCGASWTPTAVLLPHRRPADVVPFRNFFRAPITFDADQTALTFPRRCLHYPIPGADPLQREQLRRRVLTVATAADRFLTEQVRCVLRADLSKGPPDESRIARQFSMDRSTLRRKLAAEGATFRDLTEEVRFELAKQLLKHSRKELSDIAMILGYSEQSAFTRAFGRRSGMPPSDWRRQNVRQANVSS